MTDDERSPLPEEEVPDKPPIAFGAGGGLLVLLSWIAGQLIGGFFGAIFGMLWLISHGEKLSDATAIEEHLVELMTPALALGSIAGAITMVAATLILARPYIRQTDATGIGWSLGPRRQLVLSAMIGVAISSAFVVAIILMQPEIPDSELGPVARLAEESARVRWLWAIIAVTIAPVTEEFLFRGVLFSGLSKTWGIPAGAAIVSALFLMFHLAETMAFWPSTVAIGLLTIGTIAFRLLTNHLGPPIAMHLAYNAVLAIALLSGL